MRKLATWATIVPAVQQTLDAIDDTEKAAAWDTKKVAVTRFKQAVMEHGLAIQDDRCVWCTLLLGKKGRRTAHRDHIAPKVPYGKWTFLPQNLALACEYCNGFAVKSGLDTVALDAVAYANATFAIVHPYLDEPSQHLSFVKDGGELAVAIQALSAKGAFTIKNLKLDTPEMTKERARDYLYLKATETLPAYYKNLLDRATGRAA